MRVDFVSMEVSGNAETWQDDGNNLGAVSCYLNKAAFDSESSLVLFVVGSLRDS